MTSTTFNRFAGWSAFAVALAGFGYSLSFVVIARDNPETSMLLSALFLTVGGLLSIVVLLALFERLVGVQESFARLALALGLIGAVGALIHGGYNLANAINTPDSIPTNLANLPNAIDPRGLLTFAVSGLGTLMLSWLIAHDSSFPKRLSQLGYIIGAFQILIYLGRLIVLYADSPFIVLPAGLVGFVLSPLWYLWIGTIFLGLKKR